MRVNMSKTPLPGWSDGAKVLGKLPEPGRPTNLDYSRARAYCTCSRCGWGLLDIFTLIYPFSPLSPSLWETARYRLKYCLKGPFNKKQPTNQPPPSAPTASAIGPCPTVIKIVGRPGTGSLPSTIAPHDHPLISQTIRGWSGSAMVLGKLPVPGRPTNLD